MPDTWEVDTENKHTKPDKDPVPILRGLAGLRNENTVRRFTEHEVVRQ